MHQTTNQKYEIFDDYVLLKSKPNQGLHLSGYPRHIETKVPIK
uniref:Uncharacterized protein n=1 Tax=Medicago truncatula TaxID=3880 RepID=B7FG30_MEDTR|nr:unknown [Medicago truncatula]AFK49209.1 unknown [Medicago truncatula]